MKWICVIIRSLIFSSRMVITLIAEEMEGGFLLHHHAGNIREKIVIGIV